MLRLTRFRYALSVVQRGTVLDESQIEPIFEHIQVSDQTWSRLAYLNKRDNTPGRHLRLLIVPGGCRGFSYKFVLQNPVVETSANSVRGQAADHKATENFNNKKDAGCPSENGSEASGSVSTVGTGSEAGKKDLSPSEQLSKATQAAVERAKNLARQAEKEDKDAANSSDEVLVSYDDDIEFVNDSCEPTGAATGDTAVDSKEPSREKFIIDEISMKKLKGAKIDFISNLRGMAFFVDGNENVDKSCACKLSFSMKGED